MKESNWMTIDNEKQQIKVYMNGEVKRITPPKYGTLTLVYHDGSLKYIEECKKTQVK